MNQVASNHKPVDQITPDVLFPGHDGNRPDKIEDLDGRTLSLHFDGRAEVTVDFQGDVVTWAAPAQPDVAFPAGRATYETIPLGRGLIGALIEHPASNSSSLAVFDFDNERVLIVSTTILGGTSTAAERTIILQAGIGGPISATFEPTEELVGKRVQWRYSDTHRFEHLYVEPELYMWHGIVGPEANMGGAEPAAARKIADGLYLFTWSDHAVPFNGAIVIDFEDGISSAGRLVQWDADTKSLRSIIVGASGELMNVTTYEL